MPDYTRQIAYKLKIGDLLNGKTVMEEERFKFLELGDRNIVRVNIVANVIEKFQSEGEKKFASLTIDDASGQVRLKTFGDDISKFNDVEQGDSIRVIGVLRFFSDELYILPEIIKKLDPRYLLVRKLEIEKDRKEKPIQVSREQVKAVKDQVLDMLKKQEEGKGASEGVDVDKIIMEIKASPDLINQEIRKLLEEGIAYEPRPGKIRYLG